MSVKEFREKNNLTQAELAKEIGVSRQCIHQFEAGKRTISVKCAKKIAEKFNVSWMIFFEK